MRTTTPFDMPCTRVSEDVSRGALERRLLCGGFPRVGAGPAITRWSPFGYASAERTVLRSIVGGSDPRRVVSRSECAVHRITATA